MDFTGEAGFSGGSVGLTAAPDIWGGSGFDNWALWSTEQAMCATNDDYRDWDAEPSSETYSNSNFSGVQSQNRPGIEPPNKKKRNTQTVDSQPTNRSKAIGKMFYKTKLCCKFRAGVCPYITNCNFAHGIEELRKPPPNWQEIVAAQEGELGGFAEMELREEHQIPIISSPELRGDSQRSYKGRHCKKFYTEEGCPYGDNCTFLHDEHSRARESVAISVTPTVGDGYGNNGNGSNQKPSNWKTRICNKWETTGYCPFGSKCHFAHGVEELHKYSGVLLEAESKDYSAPSESKQVGVCLRSTDTVIPATFSTSQTDVYHSGLGMPAVQRPSVIVQSPKQRLHQKWKGPDKISRIYGDWIDDIE